MRMLPKEVVIQPATAVPIYSDIWSVDGNISLQIRNMDQVKE